MDMFQAWTKGETSGGPKHKSKLQMRQDKNGNRLWNMPHKENHKKFSCEKTRCKIPDCQTTLSVNILQWCIKLKTRSLHLNTRVNINCHEASNITITFPHKDNKQHKKNKAVAKNNYILIMDSQKTKPPGQSLLFLLSSWAYNFGKSY
jgi:hypothetical protein